MSNSDVERYPGREGSSCACFPFFYFFFFFNTYLQYELVIPLFHSRVHKCQLNHGWKKSQ